MHQNPDLLSTDTSITYCCCSLGRTCHAARLLWCITCLAIVVYHLPDSASLIASSSGFYAASEVKAIVEDEAASVSKESDNYWVLAAALKRYLANEGNGQLPIEVYTFVVSQPPLCGDN